jgi:hypothetical protein
VLSVALRAAALVLAAQCLACEWPAATGQHQSNITNATNDDADLGVVALMQGTNVVCTGTLVAPRVLVTAAHCVQSDIWPDAFFGAVPGQGGARIALADVRRHPAFDPATLANDVAVAVLAEPPPLGATPWPMPAPPLDGSAQGLALRLVGFGRTSPTDTSPPRKRSGAATLTSLLATEIQFAPSPSQTCDGDSGGPAFATVGGVEFLVGVTSSGDPMCSQQARDMRSDAYTAFIAPYVAAAAEGTAAAGARCLYAGHCADGMECAAALDEPRLSFCAPACAAGGACAAGLDCVSGLCRHLSPSPGALGAPCQSADECLDGVCAAPDGDAARVCTRTCFSDLAGFCPSGYACLPAGGGNGAQACFTSVAPMSGGCAAAGGADACGGLLLATWFFLLALRCRQRAQTSALRAARPRWRALCALFPPACRRS